MTAPAQELDQTNATTFRPIGAAASAVMLGFCWRIIANPTTSAATKALAADYLSWNSGSPA